MNDTKVIDLEEVQPNSKVRVEISNGRLTTKVWLSVKFVSRHDEKIVGEIITSPIGRNWHKGDTVTVGFNQVVDIA